jgi:SAM-dependent methyltransferase
MTGNGAFTPLRVSAFVAALGSGGVPWGLPTGWTSAHEQRGMCVLDAGCGRDRIMPRLAELYPNSRFTGIDLSQEAIAYAREPWELTVPGLYSPGPIGDTPCAPWRSSPENPALSS